MSFVPLSCSFVSQVPPLPAFRGNGCFHDAKIICPDLYRLPRLRFMLPFLPCARRVRFRPAFVSRLSPLPCFILPLSGGRRRISGCRIGGCIVLFRFISMRNSKKRRNCGIRASIRPEIGAESPRLCRFRPSRIYITFCTVYL